MQWTDCHVTNQKRPAERGRRLYKTSISATRDPDLVALRDARELVEGVGFRLDNVDGGGKNDTASFRK